MAGFKSESVADFKSEWVADFRRNPQLDHIGKGYVGVMILVGGETWQRNKIIEVSQQADFPK